jgi:hypothetical protein
VPGVPAGAAAGGVAVASASNAFNTFKCIVKSGRTLYDSGGVWQALIRIYDLQFAIYEFIRHQNRRENRIS